MGTPVMHVGFETHGEGRPVLFVAGWGQSRRYWHRFLPHLPAGVLGVFPDNRETGDTGPCPDGFTLDDVAADHLALMDRLGHERFAVVGHSMGGMVAQALTLRAPDRVETLVLCSTHGGMSVAEQRDLSVILPPTDVDLPADETEARILLRALVLERLLGERCEPAAPVIAREESARADGASAPMEGMVRQFQAISQFDPGTALAALAAERGLPVHVGHGAPDALVPTVNGERLAERHGVPLTRFDGIGHMVPWEAPSAFAAFVAGALGVGGP